VPEDLDGALQQVRALLLDPDQLVRAVAAGKRRSDAPPWRRVELRPIDLKDGRHLQVVTYDERKATTTNPAYGDQAAAEVDDLLALPFGNWHVQTTSETVQLRVTKKGLAQVHRKAEDAAQHTGHDRPARHLIDPGDPLFTVLGANASKRRQVDAFLRVLQAAVAEAELPTDRPLRVVDLGCGNAYLTFAAYRFLAESRQVRLTGIDQRAEMRERNTALAAELGWAGTVTFEAGSIIDAKASAHDADGSIDVVLALHACDTATDDALAQAVHWAAPVVLASPCCHHDLQRQMSAGRAPSPYGIVARHAILRERLGDVLTDAVRAALLRRVGYRVEVLAFVSAEYTPRNTMIRAVRTGVRPDGEDAAADAEYAALVNDWDVTPHLQTLLADDLAGPR
jgi:SAM-dependent methyltransferase